jgi:hypothetical protein
LVALFEALEPDAPGLGVVWAGEWQSQNWFDIAREWSLWAGADRGSATSISARADLLWRIWTKGVASDEARSRLEVIGDRTHAEPLLHQFVAIMA